MLDCVVIGADAAGIGAGLALLRAKASFVISEAKDRVGGRRLRRVDCTDGFLPADPAQHRCCWS